MKHFNIGDEVVSIKSIGNIRKGNKYKIKQIMTNSLFEDKYKFDEHYSFISSQNFISVQDFRFRKIINIKIKINVKKSNN